MTLRLSRSAIALVAELDPARLTPRNGGFGAVTGAQAMRSMQVQIRFGF
jgi:hypothetical protein